MKTENDCLAEIEKIATDKHKIAKEYNIDPPNAYTINLSKSFTVQLFNENIIPHRITFSADGGMCFVFKNNKYMIHFEIYNDKEMGYIINDIKKKEIIRNENITNLDQIMKIVYSFSQGVLV
jgi:hypothetical protein